MGNCPRMQGKRWSQVGAVAGIMHPLLVMYNLRLLVKERCPEAAGPGALGTDLILFI